MQHVKKYICFFAILIFSWRPCYASTCQIANFLDKANGAINEVTKQVKSYADTATGYTQGKIGKPIDINALNKKNEKLKKTKQRYDKAQKRVKRLQALYEKAQEKKAAMDAELKKARTRASEIKSKYEEYKSQLESARAKLENAKKSIDDAQNKISEVKDKTSEIKSKLNEIKDKGESVADNNNILKTKKVDTSKSDVVGTNTMTPATTQTIKRSLTAQSYIAEPAVVEAISQITPVSTAFHTDVVPISEISAFDLQSQISAKDVIEISESKDAEVSYAAEDKSELSMEEQLQKMDTYHQIKATPQVRPDLKENIVKKGGRREFIKTETKAVQPPNKEKVWEKTNE